MSCIKYLPTSLNLKEMITRIIWIQDCLHTHYYFINFDEGVNPLVSKAHCGCTSFHEYVITIVSPRNTVQAFDEMVRDKTDFKNCLQQSTQAWHCFKGGC